VQGVYELSTDFILQRFPEIVEQGEELKLKSALKKISFFDKDSRVWILRD
jgi:hypothetical protein